MKVLVTGGAGYIGSHTCLRLLESGHEVVVIDNFSNSSVVSLERVRDLTGRPMQLFEADVRDRSALVRVMSEVRPNAVIHFAGLKSVSQSFEFPEDYYSVNTLGTMNVALTAVEVGVKSMVFSSSATVYGANNQMPLLESTSTAPLNPYGRSKLFGEEILKDLTLKNTAMSVAILRYFNPVGAHESGCIGEDPQGQPANLMPYLARVAAGVYPQLLIYGDDFNTPDGTGVRDYIHVIDLANAHLAALSSASERPRTFTWNVGRGQGISVAEMVTAFERVTGRPVPRKVVARREGDVGESYADANRIEVESTWRPQRDIDTMIADLWRWQSKNPYGYGDRTPSMQLASVADREG